MHRLVLLAVLAAANLSADTVYMVDYLLPRGGQRGTTVEVEFHGQSLENPREVLFYEPGIKAVGFVPVARPETGFKVRFQIAPDCPLGEHVLRVRTAAALSDAVTFWVSRFPTVFERETKQGQDDSIETAQPIPMNSTVEGQILAGPDLDRDFYRIDAQQGQRISVEVEAARLGTLHNGGENDLTVSILDANGRELAKNDDSALYVQDPVLSIVAAQTGRYYVEIRQQVFYAPQQAWYRAHIGSFSRPTAIFPAGGQAGTTIQARILGDPREERIEPIRFPAEAGPFAYFAPVDAPPSGNLLRVSPFPNANCPLGAPMPCVTALPVALNGILDKPGVQTFQFAAKKGQAWKVRVYARSLGAPVDPRIWIRAVNNPKNLVDADDSRLIDLGLPSARGSWYIKEQQDPVAVFRAPNDGNYILGIEDTTGAVGPDHVYRVEIEPLRDTVYTHISAPDFYQSQRLASLAIPQGNRWTVDVQLAQGIGNSYKGEIELEAIGLPTGVTMITPRFGKGVNRLPVQFVAAPDTPQQAVLIELLARAVDPGVKLDSGSRQGIGFINHGGEQPWHYVFLDHYALAVTQPAPFSLELVAPEIAISQNGELTLKVKVTRHGDFRGPVEMIPDWLPPNISKGNAVTIAADQTEGTFPIQAGEKAAPGEYQIAISGSTAGGNAPSGVGRVRVSSAFVTLKVAQPYLTVDLQRGSVEQGKQAELVGVLHQNRPFPGRATVRLQQLPRGVKMVEPAPEITANDTQVVLHVAADADALAGLYKGLICEVAFTDHGQPVDERSGAGMLRVDAARTGEAAR